MSLFSRTLTLTVLAVALVGVALPAAAQQGRGGRGERPPQDAEPARPQRDDSVSDAVRRIERANRGQVLSAERMQYDGRDVTRIKVVDDEGRVRIYMDDPQPSSNSRAITTLRVAIPPAGLRRTGTPIGMSLISAI
jgi:hypothetical protein